MIYADFEYYKTFCGGKAEMSEAEYTRYARDASALIDALTGGQIDPENVPEEAKAACCAVAGEYYSGSKHGGIAQETTDGYSVSYAEGFWADAQTMARARDRAVLYLYKTGLLYSGVKLI